MGTIVGRFPFVYEHNIGFHAANVGDCYVYDVDFLILGGYFLISMTIIANILSNTSWLVLKRVLTEKGEAAS